MNSFPEDIKDLLEDYGLGVFGSSSDWGIFIHSIPIEPVRCIHVAAPGGAVNALSFDRARHPIEVCPVGVRVRGYTSTEAMTRLTAIAARLESLRNVVINGAKYLTFIADAPPFIEVAHQDFAIATGSYIVSRKTNAWECPQGLALWYSATKTGDFQTATIVPDFSLSSADATIVGDAVCDGSSFTFDGTGDRLLVSSNFKQILKRAEGTISMWVYPDGTTSSVLFQIDEGGTTDELIVAYSIDADGRISVKRTVAGTTYGARGSIVLTPSDWNHVLIRFPGASSEVEIYVDNVKGTNTPLDSGTLTGFTSVMSASDIDKLVVGAHCKSDGTYDRHFDGQLDEVMAFFRVLTASQVSGLYANDYAK